MDEGATRVIINAFSTGNAVLKSAALLISRDIYYKTSLRNIIQRFVEKQSLVIDLCLIFSFQYNSRAS